MQLKLISKHSIDSTVGGTRYTGHPELHCRDRPILQWHETNRHFDDDDDDDDVDDGDFIGLMSSGRLP